MDDPQGWERIATALRAARGGRSREDISQASGVSVRSIQDYESGKVFDDFPGKMIQLAAHYGWAPPALRAVYDGRDPGHELARAAINVVEAARASRHRDDPDYEPDLRPMAPEQQVAALTSMVAQSREEERSALRRLVEFQSQSREAEAALTAAQDELAVHLDQLPPDLAQRLRAAMKRTWEASQQAKYLKMRLAGAENRVRIAQEELVGLEHFLAEARDQERRITGPFRDEEQGD